ncbi:MAG: GNAT family N-acetyltransferase [Verrucomicrobiota bacterium]
MIRYRAGNDLELEAVLEVYRDSGLGERRPIDDRERMRLMIQNANLVVSAWDGDKMVGIARSISDFVYITYLSDLAVVKTHQKRGIGKELIRQTKLLGGSKTQLLLLAAPGAAEYYPKIGFTHHPRAWILP